jgi:hypothetical protein
VAGLTTADVWPFLNNTSEWPTYYEGSGPELRQGARFRFTTFSFPGGGKVTEYERPANRKAADSQLSRHRLPILL